MPISKPLHRDRARFVDKSSSFHGGGTGKTDASKNLRRPKRLPNFASASMIGSRSGRLPLLVSPSTHQKRPNQTKLLVNVTIQGSPGTMQILMKPESTVADLIAAAVRQYVKEGRRPFIPTSDHSGFELHYSQFNLESLFREEKLEVLGSRNFFLCESKAVETVLDEVLSGIPAYTAITAATTSSSSCTNQAQNSAVIGFGLPIFAVNSIW